MKQDKSGKLAKRKQADSLLADEAENATRQAQEIITAARAVGFLSPDQSEKLTRFMAVSHKSTKALDSSVIELRNLLEAGLAVKK